MKVRKVELDFSDAKIDWNPAQPEYAQLLNGLSSGFPLLEPFLIKVVRRAKELAPEHMHRDIDLFCSQEARHYKQHAKFNKLLYERGYPLEPVMKKLGDGYEKALAKRSLQFNLGYCDGFETFGPMLSYFFFEHAPELMEGWDEPTVYLWLWHLSEEFEHRAVCYELYKAIYGSAPSYFYRCFMMWYAMIQLFGYGISAYGVIIRKDREGMSRRQVLQSKARFAKVFWRLASFIGGHMITQCMRRHYDPRTLKTPATVNWFLNDASDKYGILESA